MGLALTIGAGAAAAQQPVRLEARLGGIYTGPLAEGAVQRLADAGTANLGTVRMQPGVGVAADAAVLVSVSPYVDGELRLGVAQQGLSASGPSGSWDAGDLTTTTVLAGLGVYVWSPVVLRGGLGKLVYSSGAPLFEGGASTGLLLAGGLGVRLPMDLDVDVRVDADAWVHGFGSPALRRAGAADGSVYEITLKAAITFGAGR